MSLLNKFGKKHVDILSQWVGSAITFGIAGGVLVTYASEWKAVLQYLPYYNGKYPKEEES